MVVNGRKRATCHYETWVYRHVHEAATGVPLLLSGLRLVLGKFMGQHRVHRVHTRFKVGFYPRDTRVPPPPPPPHVHVTDLSTGSDPHRHTPGTHNHVTEMKIHFKLANHSRAALCLESTDVGITRNDNKRYRTHGYQVEVLHCGRMGSTEELGGEGQAPHVRTRARRVSAEQIGGAQQKLVGELGHLAR